MVSRARASWSPALGVLLVVLVLVFGVFGVLCGGGGPASSAVASAGAPQVSSMPSEAPGAKAALPGRGSGPGCGKGSPQDADHVPGTPARTGAAYELLPALYDAHAATGPCGAGQAVLSMAPGRAPPALDPPSPMDLSVLRV